MSPIQIQKPSVLHRHKDFTVLRRSGLGLFLLGMLVLIGSLGMSDYRITNASLQASEGKISTERIQLLQPLVGQHYTSKFAALEAIEANLRNDAAINDYELGVAK